MNDRPRRPFIAGVSRGVPGLVLGAVLFIAAAAAFAADKPAFDILEYRVRGNTVLSARAIEDLLSGRLGPGRTVDDVDEARKALEQAYRDAGYPTVFVDVPEQDIHGGVVVIAVTEGKVQRLKITGARYYANGWIRDQVPEVEAGRVPRLAAFQGELRDLNARSRDRAVTPVLRPGTAPGTVEVELKVEDEVPLHGTLEANNRNTANTTATRLNASLSYENLWQRDHALTLQFQVAPEEPKETEVWAVSYAFRPELSRNTFAFYGVKNDSDVASVAGISVLGKGTVLGSRFIRPFSPAGALTQSLQLGVDYKIFKETIALDAQGKPDIQTPIHYLNWSVAWNGQLNSPTRTQAFGATLNFGVRGVVNDSEEFRTKRYNARADYLYLAGQYELTQALPEDLVLAWSTHLQLTAQPLVSNEQLGAGGADSVRGYFESEQLGDYGAQTSLELQAPNLGPRLWQRLENLRLYAFADWAGLWLHDPLPDQDSRFSIWSSGIGLRASGLGFVASLNWAHPFNNGSTTKAGDERVLFQLHYGF